MARRFVSNLIEVVREDTPDDPQHHFVTVSKNADGSMWLVGWGRQYFDKAGNVTSEPRVAASPEFILQHVATEGPLADLARKAQEMAAEEPAAVAKAAAEQVIKGATAEQLAALEALPPELIRARADLTPRS